MSTPLIRQLPLGPLQTNCYLLVCSVTAEAAIIDPSWDGAGLAALVAKEGWNVSHILLTHTHFDHIGGLSDLHKATQAPIYVHPEAEPMLALGASSARLWGLSIKAPPPADHHLFHGQVLYVGELIVHVLDTPGHAPGHVSFHLPEHQILFDGDVLFQLSIGRTDLPGGDYALLMRTIEEVLLPLPAETSVLSGHGSATTIGFERENNPFLQN